MRKKSTKNKSEHKDINISELRKVDFEPYKYSGQFYY